MDESFAGQTAGAAVFLYNYMETLLQEYSMKKLLAVLLCLLILTGAVYAQDAGSGADSFTKREFVFYNGALDDLYSESFPLYFRNGVDDVPYVELESWMDLMIFLYRDWLKDSKYDLVFNAAGTDVAYVRENEYHMQFDFEKKTILFDDFNAFVHSSSDGSLLDLLNASGFTEAEESELFKLDMNLSFDRYGDEVLLNLADYDIDMVMQDGKYYIPLQTMTDILIAPVFRAMILFNGRELMIMTRRLMGRVSDGLTEYGETYYEGQTGERSPELIEFGYNELCFVMDNLYGLKEPHEISSFKQFFWQNGFDVDFKHANSTQADELINEIIDIHLDDLHSEFTHYSYLSGPKDVPERIGSASRKIDEMVYMYGKARSEFYEEGFFEGVNYDPYIYEEVGNTAYITFDSFSSSEAWVYYDAVENGGDLPLDTIGLIVYAHQRIYRDDSPIENVVIDLSNNTGGNVDAGIFLMAWILGDAPFSVKDTFTGALSTASYRADVNLDHRFNNGDVMDDKNVFVLISPVSFSCGNLVPAALKASDMVTILGRTSGGGSCIVQPLSTAWGTMFQISGPARMSFLKNGSFYDIDTGVTPDFVISRIRDFYDHESLTEFINNLY